MDVAAEDRATRAPYFPVASSERRYPPTPRLHSFPLNNFPPIFRSTAREKLYHRSAVCRCTVLVRVVRADTIFLSNTFFFFFFFLVLFFFFGSSCCHRFRRFFLRPLFFLIFRVFELSYRFCFTFLLLFFFFFFVYSQSFLFRATEAMKLLRAVFVSSPV